MDDLRKYFFRVFDISNNNQLLSDVSLPEFPKLPGGFIWIFLAKKKNGSCLPKSIYQDIFSFRLAGAKKI